MSKKDLAKLLLEWYAQHGRELPWRVKGGAHPNPYVILVSEFMLQQTTVKAVVPYFYRFMERFPTVEALAAASLEEVYHSWQGLGYYSRARSLQTTAKMIVEDFGGVFPQSREEVLKLKGIGAYTAASFLALAFDLPETVIDGNVIRVICRLYHLTEPAAEIGELIREKATALTDKEHPADYASAIMDLGAVVCTPKNPQCLICPWRDYCQSKGSGNPEDIPVRLKAEKKAKQGFVYLLYNHKGEIFVRKRTEKGLLSGLYEFPWGENEISFGSADVYDSGCEVTHVFTHFKLTLRIFAGKTEEARSDGKFVAPERLSELAMSTLMKKVWVAAEKKKS